MFTFILIFVWEMENTLQIPYDIYESENETLIIVPLWGVKKDSLKLHIKDYRLYISGLREAMEINEWFVAIKEDSYWGKIELYIDLPTHAYFDKIHSKLTPENILKIVIPKNIIPDELDVEIE